MSKEKPIQKKSNQGEIAEFLRQAKDLQVAKQKPKGRLIFALDATASRQPTWDLACSLQNEMFESVAVVGDLAVQLCFYRGFRECRSSPWQQDSAGLHRLMQKVYCAGGQTQIERILKHTLAESKEAKVNALAFVGDCVEENPDRLCELAGQMGLQRIPAFMFQEGLDPLARNTFREIARLSGGAFYQFDHNSARELAQLLRGVAAFAAGGDSALGELANESAVLANLAKQLPKK